MKKESFLIVLWFILLVFLTSCSSLKDFPAYDQVLIYDRPYDYTFLRTIEALNTFRDWTIEETDKNKGLIVMRNTQYSHIFDRDKLTARFTVKSLGRRQTSVALEPSSQRLEQGGELLKRIDHVMEMTAAVKGEKQAQLVN